MQEVGCSLRQESCLPSLMTEVASVQNQKRRLWRYSSRDNPLSETRLVTSHTELFLFRVPIRWIATPITSTSTKIYRFSNRIYQRSCWKMSNRKINIWHSSWLSRSNSDFITAYSKILIQILGILSCHDGFMNVALEPTEEYVNGSVTNRYEDAFVRGNNGAFFPLCIHVDRMLNSFLVLYISAAEEI